uniref:Uncharacterized protein n=1 Tax=Nelumbo nucifera TaxID=4432 RepID=A0A822ZG91_NELNU|nr:TPA_asm: hypothetical protein HUJ06_014971 [Nelumbo nucifera]
MSADMPHVEPRITAAREKGDGVHETSSADKQRSKSDVIMGNLEMNRYETQNCYQRQLSNPLPLNTYPTSLSQL